MRREEVSVKTVKRRSILQKSTIKILPRRYMRRVFNPNIIVRNPNKKADWVIVDKENKKAHLYTEAFESEARNYANLLGIDNFEVIEVVSATKRLFFGGATRKSTKRQP